MLRHLTSIGLVLALTSSAMAQTTTLKPELSPIGFLVGSWDNGSGKVAETGDTAKGTSSIEPAAGGSVLLRRDHTELFGADGKSRGSFDQIMMIYPEGGTLHADYADGDHVIHYDSATVVPGRSVTFTTATMPGAPTFSLKYEASTPDTLAIQFQMAPPGQTTFRPIATGKLHKSN
ncbi:MAG: hypothetical protein IAI50_18415 [Candidatus Eremiobacteraeota bacterium]|nr:hypothetical protein [Candidatus Eremiobacteraeota bacterium]